MDQYYTFDNTAGYNQTELDAFNEELAQRLEGTERHTDTWYEVIQAHNDSIARREA
jgi:hypothetical protein